MSVGEIYAKVKSGRWRPEHRGVYRTFTGPIERNAQLWAAVLYVGRGARLSHWTAAELNGLTDRQDPVIQVKIPPGRRIVPPKGVIVHISSTVGLLWRPPRGLPPFTLPEETVIDLVHAATDLDDVVAIVAGAFGRRLVREAELRKEAASRQRLRWRHDLEEIVSACSSGTHSVLEYRHDRDVQRAHGLPLAKKQVPFRKTDGTKGFHDRCYIEYRLVIELDGKRYHPDEHKGRDQDRDNGNAVSGSTLRYGWSDVTRKACETAKQEADALRNRGWTGTLKPCSPTCRAVTGAEQPQRSRRSA
jgi:hypothetical protein